MVTIISKFNSLKAKVFRKDEFFLIKTSSFFWVVVFFFSDLLICRTDLVVIRINGAFNFYIRGRQTFQRVTTRFCGIVLWRHLRDTCLMEWFLESALRSAALLGQRGIIKGTQNSIEKVVEEFHLKTNHSTKNRLFLFKMTQLIFVMLLPGIFSSFPVDFHWEDENEKLRTKREVHKNVRLLFWNERLLGLGRNHW